jgi:hypothetical protein
MKKKTKKLGDKKFSFREQYSKSWNFIKESRNFIYAAIGVFLVFVLIGYFVPVSDESSKFWFDKFVKFVASWNF